MQSYSTGRVSRLPGVSPGTARRRAGAGRVTLQAGPHRLVPLLTREAVEELGPEVGMQATARVKSTSVHIDRT
ncbi:TOBE domain-containing protein [Streptomyces sp. NPDC004520]|uniref:TOBE domain-containing protein n=1 Tax=Streptomyces sp. NPDC004520 TaxID=3364702 RepID=UPI00368A893F